MQLKRNSKARPKTENKMPPDRQRSYERRSSTSRASRQAESNRSERSNRRSSNETKPLQRSSNLKQKIQEKVAEVLDQSTPRSSRSAKRKQSDAAVEEPVSKKPKPTKQSDSQLDELSDSISETSSSDTETSDDDDAVYGTKPSDEEEILSSRDENSKDSNRSKEAGSVGDEDNDYSHSMTSRKSDGSSSVPTSLADEQRTFRKAGDEDWNLEEELRAERQSRNRVRRRGATKRKKRDRSSQSEGSSIDNKSSRRIIQTRNGIVFQINERIEAMDFQDKWYPAKIIDVDNEMNEILIHFERWNSRYDEWVPMDSPRLRPLTHPSTRREQLAKKQKPAQWDFKVGEAVLARWTDCKLYQAQIKDVLPDGNYEVIFYDGFQRKLGPMNIHKFTKGSERYTAMEPGEINETENDDEIGNGDSCSSEKPEVVAPKEFVVEEDHNQYKCTDLDCNKGFRKEALLLSHIKYYHSGDLYSPRRHRKESVSSVLSEKTTDSLPEREQNKDDISSAPVQKSNESQQVQPIESCPKEMAADAVVENQESELGVEPTNNPVQDQEAMESPEKDFVPEEQTVEVAPKEPLVILAESKVEDSLEDTTVPPSDGEVKSVVHVKEEEPQAAVPPPTPTKVLPARISKKTYPVTKMETRHAKLCFFKEDFSYLKEAKYLKSSGHRGEAIGRTQKGFVGKQGVTRRGKPKEGDGETKKRSPSGKTEKKLENLANVKSEPVEEEETTTTEAQAEGEEKGAVEPASEDTPPADDEVVKCICECNNESGLMIQCEVCMAWQHGTCFDIESVEQVPEKYVCYLCTEPRGLRKSFRYKYDQDWFKKGELATFGFLKEDPQVASQSEAILATHDLTSSVHDIAKVLHSLQHKINIIRSENDPELMHWTKAWTTEADLDSTKSGGGTIARGKEDGPSCLPGEFGGLESQAPKNFTTFDHSYFSPKQDSVVAMLTGPREFAAEAVISTSPFEASDGGASGSECSRGDGQVANTVALDHGYAEEVAEGEETTSGDRSEEMGKVDTETCKKNLTDHVKCMQKEMSDHLDAVEEILGFLEADAGSEDSFQGSGDADDFQDLMKSIRNLSQDLLTVQRFTRYQ